MNPDTSLKFCSAGFAVLWTAGMLVWNGTLQLHEILLLAVCGAIGGFCWYRVMRRVLKFLRTAAAIANDNILTWPTPRQNHRPPSRPRMDG